MKKVLHLDSNHPVIWNGLEALGFENVADYTSSYEQILERISEFEGIIVRSRIPVDEQFLTKASKLQFIGRIGAGLENIDTTVAQSKQIYLAAAPEGNRNAVGEHTLGMLLSLLNKLHTADREVRQGLWRREENRGVELDGKTVGIIGYGNMGKQFAKKLRGFDTTVLCYDIREGIEDENAKQVGLSELQSDADIVSLHLPQTPETIGIINQQFIDQMHKPFWILNTGRGSAIQTSALVNGLESGKILGAGLDVLEYENKSFTSLFDTGSPPEEFNYLINSDNVLLTPHVGGWSKESYYLLSKIVLDKIADFVERHS